MEILAFILIIVVLMVLIGKIGNKASQKMSQLPIEDRLKKKNNLLKMSLYLGIVAVFMKLIYWYFSSK